MGSERRLEGPGASAKRRLISAAPAGVLGQETGLDLGQGGEHNVADQLKASGADRIQRVLRGVPRLVLEVDDVHGRNTCMQEWQVVVLDCRGLRDESALELLASGGFPDGVREPRRGIAIAADLQIAVA